MSCALLDSKYDDFQIANAQQFVRAPLADKPPWLEEPTLTLRGFNIKWPFGGAVADELKLDENQTEDLGKRGFNKGQKYLLIQTPGFSAAQAHKETTLDAKVWRPRPATAEVTSVIEFLDSRAYQSVAEFEQGRPRSCIKAGSMYDWDGQSERYAWSVKVLHTFTTPIPVKGKQTPPWIQISFDDEASQQEAIVQTLTHAALQEHSGASSSVPMSARSDVGSAAITKASSRDSRARQAANRRAAGTSEEDIRRDLKAEGLSKSRISQIIEASRALASATSAPGTPHSAASASGSQAKARQSCIRRDTSHSVALPSALAVPGTKLSQQSGQENTSADALNDPMQASAADASSTSAGAPAPPMQAKRRLDMPASSSTGAPQGLRRPPADDAEPASSTAGASRKRRMPQKTGPDVRDVPV